jgi:glutathione S-transferase
MTTSVLRMLRQTDFVSRMPVLEAYRHRCEARLALGRAMADHMTPFARFAEAG